MPWNGSGTFTRKVTTVSPATGGTTIDTNDMNTYTADVASGINAARAKNGENAATADLPMGGYKHTGVAAGVARTDYLTVGQQQDNGTSYVADTGVADAYVMTLAPVLTANVIGAKYSFKALNTNTGASTLDINGIGAESIVRLNGDALVASDIAAGTVYTVDWDGTNYVLDNQVRMTQFSTHANGIPAISTTIADISAATTTTDVGPTAAGATITWTALDSLPLSIDWIEVRGLLLITRTAAAIGGGIYVSANGGTIAGDLTDQLCANQFQTGTSDAKSCQATGTAKIPVDIANAIEVLVVPSGASITTADIVLIGYGWN